MREQNPNKFSNAGQAKSNAAKGEDLAAIFNYPSIGELFSGNDSRRLDEFCSKLTRTRDNLERVVRYGSRAEAESAMRAARGIEITLEFLQKLQIMRLAEKK